MIHILTAGHNDLGNLKKILKNIYGQSNANYTVTVVDDGSTDGTKEYISSNYPTTHIVKGDGNLWWTGSINAGIKAIMSYASEKDYILTINNDCEIQSNFLQNMNKISNPSTIVGSKIISRQTGKIWDIGEIVDWRNGKIYGRLKNNDRLDTLTTKGTLYPVGVFRKIGLLSSKLPHYISDYELSIRAKKHGYKLTICPNCLVINDTVNTGIGDIIPDEISLNDSFKLMFNRRSKLNVVDQFWFITLSCQNKYKLINYLRLILKIIYLLVIPFPYFHKLAKKAYNHFS